VSLKSEIERLRAVLDAEVDDAAANPADTVS
jgi:hypothetical protein